MPDTLSHLHEASGKVREMYGFGDRLLLVASDRMSAFDVVLPTPIPDKGRVLTALSRFWFERTAALRAEPPDQRRRGRLPRRGPRPARPGRTGDAREPAGDDADRVRRARLPGRVGLEGLPRHRGGVRPCRCPSGLREADRLPEPLFTPSTKATEGHDANIDRAGGVALVGEERFARLEQLSIELYRTAADYALERGIIIADTKFEFGEDAQGRLVVGDEVLTPDSSRFWPVDEYAPGGSPPSYDKQYVRDWLETLDWDKTPPGPEIPADVVAGTRRRYVEAYERLTGEPFQAYLDATGSPS